MYKRSFHAANWKAQLSFPLLLLASFSVVTVVLVCQYGLSQTPSMREMNIHAIPNHPLAIKGVRHLQGANFLRDLEIEIKNISDKPIYYFRIHLRFPDIEPINGRGYGFSLFYGDRKLINLDIRAGLRDVAINPGETYVLKVREEIWRGFEDFKSKMKLPASDTNRMELYLQEVNYGDGTGFRSGRSYPLNQTSKNNHQSKAKTEVAMKQVVDKTVSPSKGLFFCLR